MTLNLTRRLFAFVSCLLVTAAVAAQPSVLPQTGSSTNITPVVAVSPSSLPANRAVEIYLIVSNGNATSTKQIQSGDAFTITMDGGLSNAYGFPSPLLVNSAMLVPGDFSVVGANGLQIVITYTNATPKVFAPGDTLSLRVSFTTPATPGVFKLGWQGPYVKGASNGRFNDVVPRFTAVQVGAAVASSVTNVTASGPLQSSGGVTPNISLTGVVPIANGGTGSATQNFVDLSTTQTIAGVKTFTNPVLANGVGISLEASGAIKGAQYYLGGNRILHNTGGGNLFAGVNAGEAATSNNGGANSFFGYLSGSFNIACCNSFFGNESGRNTTTGAVNSFFGDDAGYNNTSGGGNSYFGYGAGMGNTTGSNNSFFGVDAGASNNTGHFNTIIGSQANVASGSLSNASAIGAHSRVDCSNCLVLGSVSDVNNRSAGVNVGIGLTAPTAKLHVKSIASDSNDGIYAESAAGTGVRGITLSTSSAAIGVYGESPSGYAGYFQGRVHATGTITNGSDVRLKQNIQNLGYGLREVLQLRPVTWRWKDKTDESLQFGLIAQEVEPIMPELTKQDTDSAKLMSLNYLGVIPVVVKAIQEQQTAIEQKNAEINLLQSENAALKERLTRLEQAVQKLTEATGAQTEHKPSRGER